MDDEMRECKKRHETKGKERKEKRDECLGSVAYELISELEVLLGAEPAVPLAEDEERVEDHDEGQEGQHIKGPVTHRVEKQSNTQHKQKKMKTQVEPTKKRALIRKETEKARDRKGKTATRQNQLHKSKTAEQTGKCDHEKQRQ